MLAGALAYPFLLLRTRPLSIAAWLLAGIALAFAVDVVWYLLQVSPAYAWSLTGQGAPLVASAARALYYLVRAVLQSFPVAAILTVAVIHLDARDPARTVRLADGLRVAAITTLYVLIFVTPIELAQDAAVKAIRAAHFEAVGMPALTLVVLVLQWLLLARFVFLWAHAVAREKIELRPALRLTRRYWLVAGLLAPLIVVAVLVTWGGQWLGWLLMTTFDIYPTAPAVPYAIPPSWLLAVTCNETARIVSAYLFDAAGVYLYVRLTPQRPEKVADVF